MLTTPGTTTPPHDSWLRGIFFSLSWVVMGCSLVGFLGGINWSAAWFFDLFTHFRPHAILFGGIVAIGGVIARDKKLALLALTVLAINTAPVLNRLAAFPAAPQPYQISHFDGKTESLSLLFSNVLTSNSDHQKIIDLINTGTDKPDIIVLTEINQEWANSLKTLENKYPYSFIHPRTDNFGMAIYATQPFHAKVSDVGDYGLPLISADFKNFVLLAAHPIPPTGRENSKELKTYISTLTEMAQDVKKPLVISGDMNTTLWSHSLSPLTGIGLARTNIWGVAWTWPSHFPPLAIQIDHIFVRDAITADFRVLPGVGSDHFPVWSDIVIPKR